jgi:hemolysin III
MVSTRPSPTPSTPRRPPCCSGPAPSTTAGSWSPAVERQLKRLDHSNIFLIIAGTYTPFAVILLPEPRRHGAALDRLDRRPRGDRLPGAVGGTRPAGSTRRSTCAGLGRRVLHPEIYQTGGAAVVTLLAIGGGLYSVGAVVYALKRPNPSPRWFGFHEVFHALTLGAWCVHYIAVSLVTYQH